jgi:predicted small lipoprotein YifL
VSLRTVTSTSQVGLDRPVLLRSGVPAVDDLRMKRAAAVLTALALAGSLAACGDDGTDDLAPTASTSTPSASPVPTLSPTAQAPAATATATASTTTPAAGGEQDDAPAGFPAEPALSEQEPSGGPLTVTAVRVARQEGYDRVVFELAGNAAGQAGWRVEYVDEPSAQGSGDPVPVEGEAALAVLITGTGYPMDTGQEEVSGDPALPGDLAVVQDVVLGAVFEGQYEAFIGTSGRQPFRVFRIGDPERVVVDVRSS